MSNWGDHELPKRERSRRRRPVVVVLALLVCAGGYWVYVEVCERWPLSYRVRARVVWSVPLLDSTTSSPRLVDLNGDGVLDVVVGSGKEEHFGRLTALDGKTGQLLWMREVADEVVSTTPLVDVNRDGTPDVFLGGRKQVRNVLALNGKDGETLWGLREANPDEDFPLLGFITVFPLDDQDGDDLTDLLVIQSGGQDDLRIPAHYYIVSAATGAILRKHLLPDARESYAVPILHREQEESYLFVGSGGETLPGQILKLKLATLEEVWGAPPEPPLQQADGGATAVGKGFVASPLLTDMDGNGRLEIIAVAMDGRTYRIDADTGRVAWTSGDKAFEAYASPAVGEFDGGGGLDVVAILNRGEYPKYDATKVVWLNGETGAVIHQKTLDPKDFCYSAASPLVLDLNHDGLDEILVNLAENSSRFHNGLFIFDGGPRKKTVLSMKSDGLSGSTPSLADVDGNGKLDLIHVCFGACRRIELTVKDNTREGSVEKYPSVKWGQYRGPHGAGVYLPEK